MTKFLRFFLICSYVFIPFYTFAADVCSKYKFDVDVNVKNTTEYKAVIKQSSAANTTEVYVNTDKNTEIYNFNTKINLVF